MPTFATFLLLLFFGLPAFTQNIKISDHVFLSPINEHTYLHVSFHEFEGFGKVASNGLLVIKNGKALLVDTPADEPTTIELYDYITSELNAQVTTLIIGHYHADCMAGMPFLQEKGVETISGSKTSSICKNTGKAQSQRKFKKALNFDFEGSKVDCRYLGGGHTEDNIVVYLPEEKILFGGCLVKSLSSKNLGNTEDADLKAWPKTLNKVEKTFPMSKIVIPGHGRSGGMDLILHSMDLLKNHKK
ncbi:subclass B1 metallo-beta-lactamase [Persicobacter diffluens]|uniref:beta-lactamase n=1 Tax=Persicobacter diffluens TaxID=981 RepID=A0AAN4VXA3_9BACT|nr:beta-lactamase [Persicobacter diffluens]